MWSKRVTEIHAASHGDFVFVITRRQSTGRLRGRFHVEAFRSSNGATIITSEHDTVTQAKTACEDWLRAWNATQERDQVSVRKVKANRK